MFFLAGTSCEPKDDDANAEKKIKKKTKNQDKQNTHALHKHIYVYLFSLTERRVTSFLKEPYMRSSAFAFQDLICGNYSANIGSELSRL